MKNITMTILFIIFLASSAHASVIICKGPKGETFISNESGGCPYGYVKVSDTRPVYSKDKEKEKDANSLKKKEDVPPVDTDVFFSPSYKSGSYEKLESNKQSEEDFIKSNHKLCMQNCLRDESMSFDEKSKCVDKCDSNKDKAMKTLKEKRVEKKLWE